MYATDDKIIQKLTTRYLNQNLDFCFSSSSLAYRWDPQLNRDTALFRIIEFANRHSKVFVGEADLRNCMDCIDHEMTRRSFVSLIENGRKIRPDLVIDPRAIQIFEAYLESYNFQADVLSIALDTLRKKDASGNFPWPDDVLYRLHGTNKLNEIGIPQGGSLSCFITNLVLHAADLEVNSVHVPSGHEILYLRYCDDMLILATSLELCQEAMAAYQRSLDFIKMPMHEPVDVIQSNGCLGQGIGHREAKSKKPYRWSTAKDGGIPWIQFLGYEIRHDGEVRIRQKSLDKQCDKITEEADKLIKTIKARKKSKEGFPVFSPGLRMAPLEILDRHLGKLIAMSVGRIRFREKPPSCAKEIKPMCWANGYKSLWDVSYNPSQLKRLDRHRDLQWKRVRSALKPLLGQNASGRHLNGRLNRPRYDGSPFSYYGQFSGEFGRHKRTGRSITRCLRHLRIMIQSLFRWIRLH